MPELIRHHTWSTRSQPKVLIEAAEWRTREHIATILRNEGYETAACPGPEGSDQRCSLASGHGCGVAEEVDVVVHALRSWDLRNVEALRALRRRLPATPVVVEAPAADVARRQGELAGCVVISSPYTAPDLVAAVSLALEGPEIGA